MASSRSPRHSALADRHLALGADETGAWNGMAVPRRYAGDPFEEVLAVRTRAGLFDISAHRIIDVQGPDAVSVLDRMVSGDVAGSKPGTALAGAVLDDAGGLIDDLLILCRGAGIFRLSHGSGATAEALAAAAQGARVAVAPNHDLHILSLQGPASHATLAEHTPADLGRLGYFRHLPTTLFGREVEILRGGYSGEAGYEIACAATDAGPLWDAILAAGQARGVRPAGWVCLETLRIEAALLFYPFEMPHPHTTPWEAGMGWAVARHKPEFRGREALLVAEGRERSRIAGIAVDHDQAVTPGTAISRDGQPAGIVTSAVFSRYLMQSIALAALDPEACAIGTELEVGSGSASWLARVVRTPFYDPLRLRTHPRVKTSTPPASPPASAPP